MAEIRKIKVGTASCGIAAGATAVYDFFRQHARTIPVEEVGCVGHCYAEPMVEVVTDEGAIFYRDVKADQKSLDLILALSQEGRLEVSPARKQREMLKVTRLAGRILSLIHI